MLRISVWNIAFTIINILVLFFFMRHFLMKPVMEILEERKKLVEKDLDEADRSKIQAAELKERYEASLAAAEKEADCIVAKARQQAQSEYERMMEQADQDARKKLQASEKTMDLVGSEMCIRDREKVLNELRTSVTGLAMTAAARLLTEKNSPEWNKRQYDVFLAGEGEKND